MMLRLLLAVGVFIVLLPATLFACRWTLAKWHRRMALWWGFTFLQAFSLQEHLSGHMHDGAVWYLLSIMGVITGTGMLALNAYNVDERPGRDK